MRPVDPHPSSSALRRSARAIQEAWDAYFGALYYPVVIALFLLVVVFNAWYGQKLADDWEQWTIAEWLISYAAGFVRRGLSGEVLLVVSGATGWPANQLVLVVIVFLFALLFALYAALLFKKRMTFWYLVLCLSPGFVLFTYYNSAAVGRKESLIYVAFALWALLLPGRLSSTVLPLAFGALAVALTLMHEVFASFTPYFVMLAYLEGRRTPQTRAWMTSLVVPLGAGVALLSILVFSESLNAPALCERLIAAGAPAKVCGGVLEYHHVPPLQALGEFIGALDRRNAMALALAGSIALAPYYLFLSAQSRLPMSPAALVAVAGTLVLLTAPLFALAVDWGRWASIHVVLLTIVAASFLPERGEQQSLPAARGSFPFVSLTAGALVLALMLGGSINYCCGADVAKPFGPVQALVSTWQELEAEYGR